MARSEQYDPPRPVGKQTRLTEFRLLLVVDFYNQINLLYGSITEFCSPQTCPEMKATDEYGTPRGNKLPFLYLGLR
jgi:Mob1/phocein family.